MYDHKFRQNDISFARPQRRRRRLWVWALGLALALAALYGVNVSRTPDTAKLPGPVAGPNVIPLEIPPKAAGE